MMREIKVSGRQKIEVFEDAAINIDDGAEAVITVKPEKDMHIIIKTGKGSVVDTLILGEKRVKVAYENHVGERSVVRTTSLWLSEGSEKMLNVLEGEGAEAYDIHLFVGKGDGKLDIDATLRHSAENTKGDVQIRLDRNGGQHHDKQRDKYTDIKDPFRGDGG